MKNKLVAALLSVVIAFGMWLYVVTNISQEIDLKLESVPVVFLNESAMTSRGLMITGGTNQTVTLNLVGNRSEIMELNNANVSVVVDLSRVYDTGKQSVSYTINYPTDVQADKISATADKSRISLTVERKVSKKVPVVVEYQGSVADGYMPADEEEAILSASSVTVEGPESVVDQMTQARIVVNMEDRNASIDEVYEYTLCNSEGETVEVPDVNQVVTDVQEITLQREILRVKEIVLDVKVISGGGATRETSLIELSTPTITVWGRDELLDAMGDVLSLGDIDLAKITEAQQIAFPVELPVGVTNLSGVEEVTVSVSFPLLTTRTFTIDNIVPVNVPAGMVAKVVTQQISVTVRGPSQLVMLMKATDITVTVDFGDMTIGDTVTKKPTVTISPSYSGVGALNYGNVAIILETPAPEPSEIDVEGQELGE